MQVVILMAIQQRDGRMEIEGFGSATRELVDGFEQRIGFSLPDDYKEFLHLHNGGSAKRGYPTFILEALGEEVPLDVLYGLGVDEALDLRGWFDEYEKELMPGSIIIGSGACGGMVTLVDNADLKGVYFWDHAFAFPPSDEEGNTYYVAESFQAFIDYLNLPEPD
ncbi:SMI1/KNR4 family protein [Lysobacter sp. KIS68-7]|uniref:SMI1/KNR4 family protein n=1 Tax=Lysobacter sp. KIS68-7 TaxID=2904252 RepID=UPI001E2E20A8|nr:SMI1/KNR4 family protein [Lysobacter sp. KIS68-7]UHQ19269.1 SMI1/KNR4 family protein [Lysobacter sp. KIS68-7]